MDRIKLVVIMIKHGIRILSTISHIIQFNLAPIYLGQSTPLLSSDTVTSLSGILSHKQSPVTSISIILSLQTTLHYILFCHPTVAGNSPLHPSLSSSRYKHSPVSSSTLHPSFIWQLVWKLIKLIKHLIFHNIIQRRPSPSTLFIFSIFYYKFHSTHFHTFY